MPPGNIDCSLQCRATLTIYALLLLLVARSACVGVVNWVGARDAAAIQTLGALHADLYALGMRLQRSADPDPAPTILQIQSRFDSPAVRAAVTRPLRTALDAHYRELHRHWLTVLRPAVTRTGAVVSPLELARLGDEVDRLARDLQRENARLMDWDLYTQLFSLVVSGGLLLLMLVGLRRLAVAPLNKLLDATERFRAGKLDVRVDHQSGDEFGRLAQGFNAMAANIESSHQELQQRIDGELRSLTQANAALTLFCSSSRSIAHSETSAADIDQLLRRFQAVLPGLQLTLCLHPAGDHATGQVLSFQADGSRQVCSYQDCASCSHFTEAHQRVFAVRCQGQELGELRARFGAGCPPGDWEVMLTQALADLIGNALQLGRQREKDNFLLLHGERNTIARELHDSLAQSLSFLQLQVVRMQMLIERGDDLAQVYQVSQALGSGLDDAYRQLRELLTTFRLTLSDADLRNAMKVAVEEFSRRGDVHLLLQVEDLAVPLAAAEEIHVLQILRESLSNCSRHAGASQVWVTLHQVGQDVELLVEDDGRGMEAKAATQKSHGLTIMQERARSIGGEIEITPRVPAGTRVRLRFRPRFLAEAIKEETA